MSITQETFDGLAFPICRVRYAGPTDTRGAKWIATMRRDNERTYRATVGYDDALPTGAQQAIAAALEVWRRATEDLGVPSGEHIAIPADLAADSYAFTFVPAYFFNR